MRMDKGRPFMHIEEDGGEAPTFSESFLYRRVGKYEARFILGVAQEYEHIIKALGPKAVRAILNVKPKLVQRLGTGEKIAEWLADAIGDEPLFREEHYPSQVILDSDAAESIWKLLHGEYRRLFNPEKDMDADTLRAYNDLTEGLGDWEQGQRQKERDRLPEKLAKQAERKAQRQAEREALAAPQEALQ